jgi:cephalosporin-C deacetylase
VTADATYGYDEAALLAVPAPSPPDDFAAFWRGRYTRARAIDVAPSMRPTGQTIGATTVHDVEFTSVAGVRIGGWLTVPLDGRVERGVVVGHGYGGRDRPDVEVPADRAAALYFCARGMPDRSRRPDIPDTAPLHVLHGIGSRDTYVLGECAADLWCAVTALTSLVPDAAARIDYVGGSFGGGIGALAVPWDDRIAAASLVVPSFGQHPLRLTIPCVGSGEAVRLRAQRDPSVLDVLPYFDAATAATFLRVPTHVAAALSDPAVPPPGQFAVYNAVPAEKELFVLSAAHCMYPGMAAEERALSAAQRRFLQWTVGQPTPMGEKESL